MFIQQDHCQILDFSQPLRIALFGMDNPSSRSLSKSIRESVRHHAVVVQAHMAQAGIFDFDNSDTNLCWGSYRRQNPNLPTIVIGSHDPQLPDALFIAKPVRMSEIKQAVDRIRQFKGEEIYQVPRQAKSGDREIQSNARVYPINSSSNITPMQRAHNG